MPIVLEPIGWVRGGRGEPTDDDWGASRAWIELDHDRFGHESLMGLSDFSHIEVVYFFDRVAEADVVAGARHPRGRTDWPRVGIFAQRGRNRPNRIGVTVCRLLLTNNTTLHVEGLDAIDGTPILDIKPVLSGFLPRSEVHEPHWAREIMKDYW